MSALGESRHALGPGKAVLDPERKSSSLNCCDAQRLPHDAAALRGQEVGRPTYSWPYLRSIARHSLPTRQLFAASVAPQRNRLVHVMPPERSQSNAAAGRHGVNSARSIALAEPAKRPTKTHVEMTNSFTSLALTLLTHVERNSSLFQWFTSTSA
jgi:hypothetical protein